MTVEELPATLGERVVATPAAIDLLTMLTEIHGPLVIHEAGGVCAGSDPMCHPIGDFRSGRRDVLVGEITLPAPLPATQVWVFDDRYHPWRDADVVLHVTAGRGSGFSLEAPENKRFVARPYVGRLAG